MNIILDYWLENNTELFDDSDKYEIIERVKMGLPSPFLLNVWNNKENTILYKVTQFNNDTILVESMGRRGNSRKDVFWKKYLKTMSLYFWRWSNKL